MTAGAPLRVVVVGPPLDASGGIGRLMSAVFKVLPAGEVDVRVLDTRGHRSSPWASSYRLLGCCCLLVWLSARGRADVVHVNTSSHGSALRKGVIVRTCRLLRLPVVLHLHASSFPEFVERLPDWAQRWVKRSFLLATVVVVLGETWADYAHAALGVAVQRLVVLPNATPRVPRAAAPRHPGDAMHLLFLGRLGARKGLPELLAALADPRLAARAWRATVAGDGDVERYRRCAAESGIDQRVTFPGWVEAEAVSRLLATAHVLVLPSHAEGLPMSVVEAFATGVPVISTPVGGLGETVVPGQNGLLVMPGDVTGLADALVRLLDDEPLRSRLAAGAHETWRSGHDIDDYARRLTAQWYRAAGRAPAVLSAAGLPDPARS
jgi:glycosyltransferase involved in cell wall biosynthesis